MAARDHESMNRATAYHPVQLELILIQDDSVRTELQVSGRRDRGPKSRRAKLSSEAESGFREALALVREQIQRILRRNGGRLGLPLNLLRIQRRTQPSS
jgi:hypothetical protein